MKWNISTNNKIKKPLLVVLTTVSLVLLITLLTAGTLLVLPYKFSDNTYIGDLNISNKTEESAQEYLKEEFENYLRTVAVFTYQGEEKRIQLKNLGINVLVNQTLEKARKKSKRGETLEIFPLIKIDLEKAVSVLEEKFKLSDKRARSASLYFDSMGILRRENSSIGIEIERGLLEKSLKDSLYSFQNKPIEIFSKEDLPTYSTADLEAQLPQINQSLNQLITLKDPIYNEDWYIKLKVRPHWVSFVLKEKIKIPGFEFEIPIDNASNIDLHNIETTPYIGIEINEEPLNEFVDEKISKWLDKEAENVNIYLDENDKVIIEGSGHDGGKIERRLLRESLELATENLISEIEIPVEIIESKITIAEELQKYGIKERLSIGHTSYYGSPPNRVHNIKTGAETYNGYLIAPEEEFSFNEILGPVDANTGYRKELVIKPEGTIPEYGGGLCQLSTTVYRAALFAGLDITERNQHSYAVSYYAQILGHGLDASIYVGGIDLKFINDTGQHVLMQAYVENDYELFVIIYGTDDERVIELDGPYLSDQRSPGTTEYVPTSELPAGVSKQVQQAHGGFRTLWFRYLTDKKGEIHKEEIRTNYRAVPAKIMVGE
jgi:vancomycin resistance protein YoaR